MFTPLIARCLLHTPPAPAAVSSWTPASIPGINGWWEAGAATNYTDAGVTNVSVSGTDTIARSTDKSGSGHYLDDDGGGSTVHPIWNSGSGKPYMLFDGTNDFLSSGYTIPDGSGNWWCAISLTTIGNADQQFAALNVGGHFQRFYIFGGNAALQIADTVDSTSSAFAGAMSAATSYVIIGTCQSAVGAIYLDNVIGTTQNYTAGVPTGVGRAFFGGDGGIQYANIKIHGAVTGSGILSSGDRASLNTYMAGLHP